MNHTNFNPSKIILGFVAKLLGVQPETHYFRKMENVEMIVDWVNHTVEIAGDNVTRATPDQAVWIRHLVRQQRKAGRIKNIDDL